MTAWECPRCGVVNAPTATQCSCRPGYAMTHFSGTAMLPMVAPPANPTSLGDVWVGETKPTATGMRMIAAVNSTVACAPQTFTWPP